MSIKFTLYDFSATPKAYYLVEEQALGAKAAEVKGMAHCIKIVDRSGSMYGDIDQLKQMLEKVMTLEEYESDNLLVSLISYSSNGDCTVHFSRALVSDVMKTNSPHLRSIRSLRATGCTGMSQALKLALDLVKDNEPTGVVLHSDGYANDPSPYEEQRSVLTFSEELARRGVFVNTVAYRQSSDFAFLAKIANSASGKCVLAHNVKEVHDAIRDTADALGRRAVAQEFTSPNAEFVALVSPTARRVNGAAKKLRVGGLRSTDAGKVYVYEKVSKTVYDRSSLEEAPFHPAVYAFASANLAAGNLNTAKYALVSTRNEPLARRHAKALTSEQIALFAGDLNGVLFDNSATKRGAAPLSFGDGVTVLDVLKAIEANKENLLINIEELSSKYRRRSVKRIPGVRNEDGSVLAPWLKTEDISPSPWKSIGSIDINRNSASANILVLNKVRLVEVETGNKITNVAGVDVSELTDFANYTIVGDGDVTVPELVLKANSDAARKAFSAFATVSADGVVRVDLLELPVMGYSFAKSLDGLAGAFEEIANLSILGKIVNAIYKEESATYTKEQVQELGRHFLSKNLNLNFPTTTEYKDLQEALNNGSVDIRTSYKVDVGNRTLVGTSELMSANELLDRWFEQYVIRTDEVHPKATFLSYLNPSIGYRRKEVSSRQKESVIDKLMLPYFDALFGGPTTKLVSLAQSAGCSAEDVEKLVARTISAEGLKQLGTKIGDRIETLYRANVVPLVFFVGSTGLLPDSIQVKAETAEEIKGRYNGIKLGKGAKSATFFDVDGTLLAIYAENVYYSTGSGSSQSKATPVPSKPASALSYM